MRFDLSRANALIEELEAAIYRLEQVEVEQDPLTGRVRHNHPDKAEVSRDLQYAEDLARAVATEVKMEYWRFKGKGDPR